MDHLKKAADGFEYDCKYWETHLEINRLAGLDTRLEVRMLGQAKAKLDAANALIFKRNREALASIQSEYQTAVIK